MEPVLTEADLRFFDDNGYVVARSVVPPENLDRLIAAMWTFLDMNPADSDDWYRAPLPPGGMIEMYQHQALWDNRQSPRLHRAFADIFRTEALWVSFDRANLKPPYHPAHPEYDNKGFLHWDMDVTQIPSDHFGVQGVLYLTDTDADMGGFRCAPGHHKVIEAWARTRQPDETRPDMSGVEAIPIVGKAGDLVIWNRRLYHGNGQNLGNRPRMAQYISMGPAGDVDSDHARDRVRQWRERDSPQATWAPGDPRRWEQTHGTTATLTPLGRKLLGLEAWG